MMMHEAARVRRRRLLAAGAAATAAVAWAGGAARAAEGGGKPTFIPLGEFTVNLPPGTEGLTYLVIDVTLETTQDCSGALSAILPRLKEAVVRRLMEMSAQGSLQPQHIGPDQLKGALRAELAKAQPNSVRDVLITRLLFG